MAFVLDASVTAVWAFDDEDHPRATAAFRRIGDEGAQVPSLWWFEIRNIVIVNERRGRVTQAQTAIFLRSLELLPILIDRQPDDANVLALARRYRLAVHDAAYLELALRQNLALATLDVALARAAEAEKIALIGAEV